MTDDHALAAQWIAAALPPGFEVGVATAAFQIEGATREAGRGPSGWDEFAAEPGHILNADTADVACDHYHRVPEDVALMKGLGVDAYRFSLAWPRLQPGGTGALNPAALDFYDGLLDRLLDAGISPMATLYHWDTPLPLEHGGGWLNRDTAERFGEFAALAGSRLGDRVDKWVTMNEPATVTLNGYGLGIHAPGQALLFDSLPSAHHQLLAHGRAVAALRGAGVSGGIGITNIHTPVVAANPDDGADVLFAALFDILHNRIFADPVLLGSYPPAPAGLEGLLAALHGADDDDLAAISVPLDFYGLNYYAPTKVAAGPGPAAGPDGVSEAMAALPFRLEDWPDHGQTAFGWPVAPEYFGTALAQLRERYGDALPPVYITENGASFDDAVASGGRVHDAGRIDYVAGHLSAALAAVQAGGPADGIDLRGYYVWSLLDNFEWAAGYSQRFGLVHVDFDTLVRTPKDSYHWLASLQGSRNR